MPRSHPIQPWRPNGLGQRISALLVFPSSIHPVSLLFLPFPLPRLSLPSLPFLSSPSPHPSFLPVLSHPPTSPSPSPFFPPSFPSLFLPSFSLLFESPLPCPASPHSTGHLMCRTGIHPHSNKLGMELSSSVVVHGCSMWSVEALLLIPQYKETPLLDGGMSLSPRSHPGPPGAITLSSLLELRDY